MNFSVRPGSLSLVIGLIHGAPYGGPSPKYSSILGCLGSANKPMYNRTQGRSMKPWYPNFGGERCPLWVGSGLADDIPSERGNRRSQGRRAESRPWRIGMEVLD